MPLGLIVFARRVKSPSPARRGWLRSTSRPWWSTRISCSARRRTLAGAELGRKVPCDTACAHARLQAAAGVQRQRQRELHVPLDVRQAAGALQITVGDQVERRQCAPQNTAMFSCAAVGLAPVRRAQLRRARCSSSVPGFSGRLRCRAQRAWTRAGRLETQTPRARPAVPPAGSRPCAQRVPTVACTVSTFADARATPMRTGPQSPSRAADAGGFARRGPPRSCSSVSRRRNSAPHP